MKTHLERFIRFLAAEKGLSAAYQLSVRQTLEEFARFLGTEDADLSHVDIGTLTEFLRHLQARGMARSSMRVEMVHLRIFFRWLAGMGMLEKDPSAFLEMPRQGLSLPHVLDQQTVSTLLESVDVQDIPLGCRDRALLEMIYACGMRVSEVISCKLESLDMDDAFVRVLGKGEKTRLVPVGIKCPCLSTCPRTIVTISLISPSLQHFTTFQIISNHMKGAIILSKMMQFRRIRMRNGYILKSIVSRSLISPH